MLQVLWRGAIIYRRLGIFIGDVVRDPHQRASEMELRNIAVPVNPQMARHGRTVLTFAQRAHIGAEHLGQHRHDPVREIDRIAALPRLAVELATGSHVVADIGNRDERVEAALPVRLCPDRIVMVARVGRIDRNDRQVSQILAVFAAERQLGRLFRFAQRLLREHMRDAVLGDGNQAEAFRSERIAHHFDHLDARTIRAPHPLGDYQLAFLRLAQIGDWRRIADALVDRGKPGLAAAVDLHHAHQPFGARGQFFHRMRDPAAPGFLGPREHAVAAFERGHPFSAFVLQFAHGQARWFTGRVRRPIVRNGDCFAIRDLDHTQHGYLGHTAHAVIGGFLAVDHAFFGHVLEQPFERDLFLALEAKRLGDLALASRNVRRLKEFEYLFLAGHALRALGWSFRQISKPVRSEFVQPQPRR